MTSQKNLTNTRLARILADMKPLKDMLREWRTELKLTPADAARRCKISPQLYWYMEHVDGYNPRVTTLQKVAEGTGIPFERLAVAVNTRAAPESVPA